MDHQQRVIFTLLAGVAAGVLPFIPDAGIFFTSWAPFLPLFFVGFALGDRPCWQAACIATLLAVIIGGGEGVSFAVFIALPACFLVNRLTSYTVEPVTGRISWYPTLRALSELTLIAAGLFMFFAISVSYEYKNSLLDLLKARLTFEATDVDPTAADELRTLTAEYGFVLLALMAWVWVLASWLMGIMVNNALVMKGQALRRNMGLTFTDISGWVPALLAVSAALALVGEGNDNWTGKSLFLIFLLPYFLAGMARIHAMSHHWHMRQLWLFLIYVILIFLFWVVALVAAMGLYHHLSEMLDKRQKIR